MEALKGTTITQVVCGELHTAALTEDGGLFTWGLGKVRAVTTRSGCFLPRAPWLSHTHTMSRVGRALQDGRLGHRNTDSSLVPLKVKELEQYCIVEAACGGLHTAALTGSGPRSSLGLV